MYKFSEKMMGMNKEIWGRHANPWSVYTRFTILPLLAASIWSRYWLGWDALMPFGLVVFWTWLNPRLFPAPKSIDSWASKGVLGEQIFLTRKTRPLPTHHLRAAHLLTLLSIIGALLMVYGLWKFDFWATLGGTAIAMGAKAWFFDRMVWLYEDVSKDRD